MRILIVGGGGREHALARIVAASPLVSSVLVAPGNPGIAAEPKTRCVAVDASDVSGLLALARTESVGLTIVGPEAPLVAGLVDAFEAAGLRVLGPRAAAARLEGSKAFAKEVMAAAGVPTARAEVHTTLDAALAALSRWPTPEVVIKVDGLAAGKGVVVAENHGQAASALHDAFGGRLGAGGDRVLLETWLAGDEVSVIALCDGERALLFPPAQDHKRIGEGDTGPNTGGMGTYAPAPVLDATDLERVRQRVIEPVLAEMRRRGTPFRGFLFAGLMVGPNGFDVLEFNVRLGDPEAQVMLGLLAEDPVPAFVAAAEGDLTGHTLDARPGEHAACVVLAAAGYPEAPRRGDPIELPSVLPPAVAVLHAGTRRAPDGRLLTDGGRVLGITGRGPTLAAAVAACYEAAAGIRFEGRQMRRDIAHRALHAGGDIARRW
jgi:phosphoribosylamine--glycine ligase